MQSITVKECILHAAKYENEKSWQLLHPESHAIAKENNWLRYGKAAQTWCKKSSPNEIKLHVLGLFGGFPRDNSLIECQMVSQLFGDVEQWKQKEEKSYNTAVENQWLLRCQPTPIRGVIATTEEAKIVERNEKQKKKPKPADATNPIPLPSDTKVESAYMRKQRIQSASKCLLDATLYPNEYEWQKNSPKSHKRAVKFGMVEWGRRAQGTIGKSPQKIGAFLATFFALHPRTNSLAECMMVATLFEWGTDWKEHDLETYNTAAKLDCRKQCNEARTRRQLRSKDYELIKTLAEAEQKMPHDLGSITPTQRTQYKLSALERQLKELEGIVSRMTDHKKELEDDKARFERENARLYRGNKALLSELKLNKMKFIYPECDIDKGFCINDATRFKSHEKWRVESPLVYEYAQKKGWVRECCQHMPDIDPEAPTLVAYWWDIALDHEFTYAECHDYSIDDFHIEVVN